MLLRIPTLNQILINKNQRPHESVEISEKEDLSVDFRAFFDGIMSDWFFQRKKFDRKYFSR